jgi:lipopolysaccharide transport system ATP-binding protein
VYLNAAVLGVNEEETRARFEDIAAFADIGEFINQPVKTYSSGMIVRLAFAVAINVAPQILIVDEALSVGDELFQRKCFSRIEAMKRSGVTILFVSHSGSAVVELCDRAILLDAGDMLAMGVPKAVVGTYQRLIYAPPDKRAGIRHDIRASGGGDGRGSAPACVPQAAVHSSEAQTVEHDRVEWFDPNLTPQSTLEYESHGAAIERPEILTLSGQAVNCLARGQRYRFAYRVRFDQGVTQVRFGMLIKTMTGLELGGAVSAGPGHGIAYQASGTTVHVEFRFTCNLNPGSYFLNAGVTGHLHEAEIYLHRVLDICMFKVMPVSDNTATALVDFNCTAEIDAMSTSLQHLGTE